MAKHHISSSAPTSHFFQIRWETEVPEGEITRVHLPLWRPGRYEMQNFPKNVRHWQATDEKGNVLPFYKCGLGTWEVQTVGIQKLIVSYDIYAYQFDAGGSYCDENVYYATPGNCFLYTDAEIHLPQEVYIDYPESWTLACSLPKKDGHILCAETYTELADSPFIAAHKLIHEQRTVFAKNIHLWFYGPFEPTELGRLNTNMEAYEKAQVEMFGDFPVKSDYHYIFIMHPYPFHHGVEHMDNTVISMGPDPDFNRRDFYREFLGISCHEFFHLWNVKRIRPVDMFPYRYQEENLSSLGWVYEGFTTYFGDLLCYETGGYTVEEWFECLSRQFQKHMDNPGRLAYSVAESSLDTWLDGYIPGIPGRKVNIYTEGFWAACILDYLIQKKHVYKKSLKDLMRILYEETWKKQRGYDEAMIKSILEKHFDLNTDRFFEEVVHGKNKLIDWFPEVFAFFHWDVETSFTDHWGHHVGVRINKQGEQGFPDIWPGSPAEMAGLDPRGALFEINGILWASFEYQGEDTLTVKQRTPWGELTTTLFMPKEKQYYPTYRIGLGEPR